ncbi:hypothetical protein KI688_004572 [Linnemannia hyalina]|uniref:Uncharacterized protein n=1 Tax=Linnemannia hyalina TaxID=64524 RepID=A0A9P7XL89_9FUNG|nr:hypothetical protein KI688_004572 [Linnemannia hyalina]
MKVFTRRSTTTAVAVGIDQDSFLIGKDGLSDGSAVGEEEGVGAGNVEINSGLAGSIVLQPTAAAAAAAPEQSVEDDDDLEGEVVEVNGEAATEKYTAERKKGILTTRPDTPHIGRNPKSKHHHHRGQLGGQHGKKKGVVHRHRIPGGRGDKKHRYVGNKDRKHGHMRHEKHRHQGGGQGQDSKKPPRVRTLIIDKIKCHRRRTSSPPHVHHEESLLRNFDNNDGDDDGLGGRPNALNTHKRAKQKYVFMSSPCSNYLPPSCPNENQDALVRPLASIDESLEYEVVDHDEEVDGEGDSEEEEEDDGGDDEDEDDYEDVDESAVDGRLEASDNDATKTTLPLNCGYENNSVYTCSAIMALPVKKSACESDRICLETPTGPTCTPPACICEDDATHCGSTFDAACALKSDTLYKCTNGGLSSVAKDCALTGICSANIVLDSGGKIGPRTLDICVCASTFDAPCNYDSKALLICGDLGDVPIIQENCIASCEVKIGPDACAFDECRYEKQTIYTCKANQSLPQKTVLGTCSANVVDPPEAFEAVVDNFCIDKYKCTVAGTTVCASTFDASCNYKTKNLMACNNINDTPTLKKSCTASCTAQVGPDVCALDPCACTKAGDTCGSAFPDTCNYEKNSHLYKCVKGALPTPIKDCGTGTCSASVVEGASVDFSAMANDICIDQCACKEAGVGVYGSVFNSIYAYNSKALMNCAKVGDVPTVKETCTLSCTVQAGQDVCACTTTGDTCGTAFPANCNLKTTTIYNCAAVEAIPVKKFNCLGNAICFVQPIGPKCTLPECISKDDNKHCGSAFFGACNMVSNTLYNCAMGALPTVVKDCSPGVCSGNIVSDVTAETADTNGTVVAAHKPKDFTAMAGDEFCIDECAFKESEALVCGSSFDAICNYNASALMSCENTGDMPVLMNVCTTECTRKDITSECNLDPCACIVAGDTCGGLLPANCGYDPTIVYSCAGPGAAPVNKLECKSGSTCTTSAAGPTCRSLDCICKDNGHHCGSQFPSSCEYSENTLYRCTMGLVPADEKDCEMESYDNKTLMSCGNQGDVPVVSETCTSYCDVISSAPDVCTFDPCACRRVGDTCGKSFPANCGYLPDSLYTCATNRTLPAKKSACQSFETCHTVPGGVDVCLANKVCDCVGTGTIVEVKPVSSRGDFIQFIQDNIGSFPVVGPLIITLLLAGLKSLVIDLQTGLATSIGGTVAFLYGILQMLNIVSPANQTNPIRDYLLRLLGLLDIPTECGGGGTLTLSPLIDGLFTALTAGASVAIYASYTALNAALTTLDYVPYIGTIMAPFRYMLEAVKQIADCLSTGTATTTTGAIAVGKLELERDGEGKVGLLGDDGQDQQPLVIEQLERMLVEV